MRVLSIRQPWASLIASGRKTIELRTWATPYRGPILVLAGGALWKGEHDWPTDGPRGVSLCIVDLVDVRLATRADERSACFKPRPGDLAFVLENARAVRQVPVKGKLGLYQAPDSLLAQIRAA